MRLIDYAIAFRKNQNNKELKRNLCHACYEVYDHVRGNRNLLEEVSKIEGVSSDLIYRYARVYMREILKMSDDQYFEIYVYPNISAKKRMKVKDTPFNQLLLKLMEEENPENILSLIQDTGFDLRNLASSNVADFVYCYFPEKKEYLVDQLKAKIKIYTDFKKEENKKERIQRKEELRLQEILAVQSIYQCERYRLLEYVEGDFESKDVYCERMNFPIKDFELLVEYAKEYEPSLYQMYCEKWQSKRSQRYAILCEKVKQVIVLLEKGIECENGLIRPFDLIDYFQLIHKDYDSFMKMLVSLDLTKEELKTIRTFMGRNKNNIYESYKEIEQIYESVQEVGCLKDKNGSLIPGSGRVIELSEKEGIIDFLKSEHVPLNQRTYAIAFRRYLNGTLFVEESRSQGKKRMK